MPTRKPQDPFDAFDDDDFISDYAPSGQRAPEHAFDLEDTADYPASDPFGGDPFADEDYPSPRATPKPAPAQPQPAQRQALSAARPTAQGPTGGADASAISIPRIAIHFFVETNETLRSCDATALDRRMSRAQCVVKRGGIAEAIATYQHEPTPSLIVVESALRGRDLLDVLGQLAEVCDLNTKVIVIGAHNDVTLYRELIRQGVSEYLVAPVQPIAMIRTIATLFTDPETPFVGRAIAFVGARGGAGASALAHNFAYNLSEVMQANTVIVDYDLPFGTAGLDFNQDPLHGMADALSEPDRLDAVLLDRMLTKCTDRLSLFSSPATLDTGVVEDENAFEEVTRKVRSVAPFVVMDLPHVWTPWLKRNLITADEVVIVATPDLASLRNAKNIVDLLRHSRPNDAPPRIVLNQTEMPGRPEIPVRDFTAALGIEPSAVIPFDARLFGQAANNGQMINEMAPNSRVAEALTQLTSTITGRTPETGKAKKGSSLLSSLFRK